MSEQIICGADMGEGRKCNVQLGHPGGHIFINPVVTIDDAGNGINVYAELQQLRAKFAASEQQCAALTASEAHAREQWAEAVKERNALGVRVAELGKALKNPVTAMEWSLAHLAVGPQGINIAGEIFCRRLEALATPAPEKQP
jgi:hypothetical protein